MILYLFYKTIHYNFSHFTLFRVECEELFCKTNVKLLKLILEFYCNFLH